MPRSDGVPVFLPSCGGFMFVMTAFGSSETHKLTWLQSCQPWSYLLPQAGVRRRAELLYQQLDGLQALRREVRPSFAALCFRTGAGFASARSSGRLESDQCRESGAASGNYGPTVGWALRRTTVRNSAL
jgi:hypothetical protein